MTRGGQSLGQTLRAAREGRWDIARAERDTRIRARYLTALEAGTTGTSRARSTPAASSATTPSLGLDPEWCSTSTASRPIRPRRPDRSSPIPRPRRSSRRAQPGHHHAPRARRPPAPGPGVRGLPRLPVPDLRRHPGADRDRSRVGPRGLRRRRTSCAVRPCPTPRSPSTASARTRPPPPRRALFLDPGRAPAGSNVITLVATDPLTGRQSSPVRRTITVSLDTATPLPGGAPNLSSPEADAVISGGVTVAGTVAPEPRSRSGRPHRGADPSFEILNLAGQPVAVPPWSPTAPEPVSVSADLAGAFSVPLSLGIGTWELRVSASPSHPPRRPAPPRQSRPSAG